MNMIFPKTTTNSDNKIKSINYCINDKINKQSINLIPIYKNIRTDSFKKKHLINNKSIENKSDDLSGNVNYSSWNSTNINNNNASNFYSNNLKTQSNQFECNEDSFSNEKNKKDENYDYLNNEKKVRIPLQNIKFINDRNKIYSAKINTKKTNNKFSLNFEINKRDNNNNTNASIGSEKDNNNSKIIDSDQKNTFYSRIKDKIYKANLDRVRISKKAFGCIEGYAAITTEGVVRDYNEDRVSIILNIPQPPNFNGVSWPNCSFFGIYDGHGGSACAEFLRDNLHKFVQVFNFY